MADSWQAANGQLVTALRSQSASSLMIRAFVTVAVALGIASVLVVSVVQRQREIGILRAMGTPRHRILGVFLLRGGIVGLGGSLLGAGLGGALAVGFTRIARNADGSPLFPIVLGAELFVSTAVLATAVGVLAAWLQALRAFDPALPLLAPACSALERAALALGQPVLREVFADRAYQDDGQLVPRREPGAVLHDPDEAVAHVLAMLQAGGLVTRGGRVLPTPIDSVCVHGDGPQAVQTARRLREALAQRGWLASAAGAVVA